MNSALHTQSALNYSLIIFLRSYTLKKVQVNTLWYIFNVSWPFFPFQFKPTLGAWTWMRTTILVMTFQFSFILPIRWFNLQFVGYWCIFKIWCAFIMHVLAFMFSILFLWLKNCHSTVKNHLRGCSASGWNELKFSTSWNTTGRFWKMHQWSVEMSVACFSVLFTPNNRQSRGTNMTHKRVY